MLKVCLLALRLTKGNWRYETISAYFTDVNNGSISGRKWLKTNNNIANNEVALSLPAALATAELAVINAGFKSHESSLQMQQNFEQSS